MNKDELAVATYEALTKGINPVDIHEYLTRQAGVPVSRPEALNYILVANRLFSKIVEDDRDAELGKGITRLNMLFEKTLKIQDYKACLAIQKEINVLLSLKKEPDSDTLPDLSGGYDS
jgi:hypothetical protein